MNDFDFFFEICGHIVHGHVPQSIFVCGIMITRLGYWWHLTHCSWRGHLLANCLHTHHSIQIYIYRTF